MRTDESAALPVWAYIPLALLGAGVVLLRVGAFAFPPALEPAIKASEPSAGQVESVQVSWTGIAGASTDVAGPVDDGDAERPVLMEYPAMSGDPDVRAEAAALQMSVDQERESGD